MGREGIWSKLRQQKATHTNEIVFFQFRNWKRVAWSPFPPAAMCSDQASETQQTHRAKARAEMGPADDTQSPRLLIPSVSLTSLPQSQSHQQINSLFGLSWAELGFSWLEPGKWKESEVAQSCLTLCDPTDCGLPDFSVHGIFQAAIPEWVAISFSRGSSRPTDQTWVSCIAGRHFTLWPNPTVYK